MKYNGEVLFVLEIKDLWDEFFNWWGCVFFIYHIKSCNKISLLLELLYIQYHFLVMILSDDLQTANDDSDLE